MNRLVNMSAGGRRPVVAVVPHAWDEKFDFANIGAFDAAYNAIDGYFVYPTPISDFFSVSGGKLNALAYTVVDDFSTVTFGPALLDTPFRECWIRLPLTMSGGTYDASSSPPVQFYLNNQDNSVGLYFNNFVGIDGPTDGFTTVPLSPNLNLSAGDHTIVLCISRPTPTSLKAEYWLDPIRGHAADVSNTQTGIPADDPGFISLQETITGPHTAPQVLSQDAIEVVIGDRASDPFSLL